MDVGNVDDEEAEKHRYDDGEAEGEGRPRLDERQLVGTKEEVNDVLSDERLDEETRLENGGETKEAQGIDTSFRGQAPRVVMAPIVPPMKGAFGTMK